MANILVVDDNDAICKSLAKLLNHAGHNGFCVTSGEDALQFVKHKMPDLMILDVMMPGMDGLEVLRRLQSDEQTKKLPVVMFSAVTDEDYRRHVLGKGAIDYWVKASVAFEDLENRLRKLLPKNPEC
jgi:CheY-like chemotaxis protein